MAGSMNGKVLKEYLNKVIPDDANIRMKNAVEHEDAPPCGTIDEVVCQYSSVGFNLYVDFARDERTYEIVRKYKNDNHPDHNKVIKTGPRPRNIARILIPEKTVYGSTSSTRSRIKCQNQLDFSYQG